LKIAVRSDPGQERPRNEDNYCCLEHKGITLLAVADGMGGHAAGDVASHLAVETLKEVFRAAASEEAACAKEMLSLLERGIKQANQAIYRVSLQEPDKSGMGTTLTLGAFFDGAFYWGHVGDSRAYRITGNRLERLTRDHSLVEEMVFQGKITPEEARFHPQKNVLTRVLGTSLDVEVDLGEVELEEGDEVLFCTDGLTSFLEEEEILKVLMENDEDPEKAASILVGMANSRGGSDNITLIYAADVGRKRS